MYIYIYIYISKTNKMIFTRNIISVIDELNEMFIL